MADPTAGISPDPIKFEEAIRAIKRRVPMTEDVWSQLEQDELEYAFTVADVTQLDMVVDVYEAVKSAVDNGTTLEDFKAQVGDTLESAWGEEDPARLETVFRNNVMSSYNAGRHEAAQEVRKTRPYWRYDAIVDSRTSDICRPCDGVVLPADHAWWRTNYPPRHHNCRCIVTTLTEEQAQAEGISANGPSVKAADGFGQAPSSGGDWEPDAKSYPDDLAAAFEEKETG